MVGGIVLPDGRRRLDAIREDYAAHMRRSDIARKYGVAFQIVYQATRDMGDNGAGGRGPSPTSSSTPSHSGGVAVTSGRRKVSSPTLSPKPLTVTSGGGFLDPEFVEEMSPVEEDLFPPS